MHRSCFSIKAAWCGVAEAIALQGIDGEQGMQGGVGNQSERSR